jgi:hypothetical protein
MSRTDRHLKLKYMPEHQDWLDSDRTQYLLTLRWWITIGNKHFGRQPFDRKWNAKEYPHNRAAQKRFWQRDIDKNNDVWDN